MTCPEAIKVVVKCIISLYGQDIRKVQDTHINNIINQLKNNLTNHKIMPYQTPIKIF